MILIVIAKTRGYILNPVTVLGAKVKLTKNLPPLGQIEQRAIRSNHQTEQKRSDLCSFSQRVEDDLAVLCTLSARR